VRDCQLRHRGMLRLCMVDERAVGERLQRARDVCPGLVLHVLKLDDMGAPGCNLLMCLLWFATTSYAYALVIQQHKPPAVPVHLGTPGTGIRL
jgi:hypothetical protein